MQAPVVSVVVGIIEHQGHLLITKRKAGTHLEGSWEFPGGKQEVGESLEECLHREIWEELRVTVSAPIFFANIRHEYAEKLVDLHFFRCSWMSGIPQAIDCCEFAWVRVEHLQVDLFPAADQKILQKLISEGLG